MIGCRLVVHENENEKDFKNKNGTRTIKILFQRTKIIASPTGLQLDFSSHYCFAEFGVKLILQILFQLCKF
jgi:hypothetical protein